MNIKKILFSLLLTAGCLTASAQEPEYKEVFNPHWYIQLQGGAQYTLGERSFGNLISPNVQVAGGYRFNSVLGLRLSVEGWQSKAGSEVESGNYKWKWKYVAPRLELTFDLTNAIGGYNPNRVVSAGLMAGVGANIAWGNDEAATANSQMLSANSLTYSEYGNYLGYLWDGTETRLTGRVGAYLDFNVSKSVSIGLELNANVLNDKYNSKKTDNPDWYFNGLVGIKFNLGKTSKKVAVEKPAPVIIEKIVEKPVEKVVEKVVYKGPSAEPLRRDIFFNIRGTEVSKTEMPKVEDIVTYLNKYQKAKVTITGYADKGTGNAKVNKTYAEKRAQMVADLLVTKYGIDSSRIKVDSKGDTEQPFEINELNRVSICIAESE